MKGYLVAQTKDRVRILEPGRYFGLVGYVADERPHDGPTVTARDCCVSFADDLGGGTRWFHADDLEVESPSEGPSSSGAKYWFPSDEDGDERFSLGRRAFNADEADCCACAGTCANLIQGPDLPICRALPRPSGGSPS